MPDNNAVATGHWAACKTIAFSIGEAEAGTCNIQELCSHSRTCAQSKQYNSNLRENSILFSEEQNSHLPVAIFIATAAEAAAPAATYFFIVFWSFLS